MAPFNRMKVYAVKVAPLPPGDFVRVHRSHIVRVDRIVDLEDTTIVVERDVIPVGASYREALLSRLNTL